MWMTKSFFALLVVGTIANCAPTDQIDLPRAVSDFASDLYEQVSLARSGNVIISPLSVATLLALLSQAANGRTYTELQHGLHLKNIDKVTLANQYYRFAEQLQRDIGSAQFNLANQIYVQQGHTLNRNFQEIATKKFRSGVQTLDFKDAVKSAEIINRYVAEQTHGKIPKLVSSDSLSTDTDVFLVNAIYFKGKWEHPFNKTSTRKDQFHTHDKQTILTEFMHMDRMLNFFDSEELKASLVELKYADSKFSFVIVLPHPSSNLQQLASKIRQINLANVFNQMRPHGISLRLPKFKVEYSIQLKEILKQLGMGTMFSSMADLSGLLAENDDKNLYVSKVIHKAFIEVDEEGSTAGGSTGAEIRPRTLLNINANSPFMYYIRDTETNTIVFNGRIETLETK